MNIKNNEKGNLNPEYVKEFYDHVVRGLGGDYTYSRWFSDSYSRSEYNQIKQAILFALGHRMFDRVLEVGGGDGVWTELLFDRSRVITEVDISEEMLKAARKRFGMRKDVEFVCSDFVENRLPSESYDLWYGIRCFEYFSDKKKAVEEIYRLLKPGGEVILVTKNPSYVSWKKRKKKVLHQGQVSMAELASLFSNSGFTVKDIYPGTLGKKFGFLPARFVFNVMHELCRTPFRWMVPGTAVKYLSESFLLLAKKP